LIYRLFDNLINERMRMKRRASQHQIEIAAIMLRALADPARLNALICLADRERSVTELADITGEKIATISARLLVHSAFGEA
jgi:DNA-binding transcriptional ArsR family regulator